MRSCRCSQCTWRVDQSEFSRAHPAATGEIPRADHAAGVEVVAFVPAVVGDLMALMGLDQREQCAAEGDLAAEVGVVGHLVMPNRSSPDARIAFPRSSL